ncbi:MAG: type ISP restriction/modification enzyme [Armatimonadota bacterium]
MTVLIDYLHTVGNSLARGDSTEHTHRPALKAFVESIHPGIMATNEPRRIDCGAPDLIVTKGHTPLGYIETKDIGRSLDEAERSEQLSRYQESLGNLILTDYLEFRWYVGKERRAAARLATFDINGKLREDPDGSKQVVEIVRAFLETQTPTVANPRELAQRMAHIARLIRETITKALSRESDSGSLHSQLDGFRETLLHDLTEEQFADMYAQTICYGLFAARCNTSNGAHFTRQDAAYDLPKTNPFLRKMFQHIAGYDLDDRIAWAVDDVANLLAHADMERILQDFGKRTRQEDPVVHFYETFLAEYDPKMREARGVYYTPEPVVSYIVRSVDHILKTDFELPGGLADPAKVKLKNGDKEREVHKVQILDPATGTGTFLHGVIDLIHESLAGNQGMWSGYVRDHLLPRVHGFELLMAPYAVTHMKLGLQLQETGYDFEADERLHVYLTNTLEEAEKYAGHSLFSQFIVEEANAASRVKKDVPVMVVLGNPPYSGHSANKGQWINDLLHGKDTLTGKPTESYFQVDGKPLGEKNPKWLNDDYVKFIRFAQWRIEQTGHGVLAYISNHGYLDNPTFRGMRQSLMNTFDDIYVLDLHGNSKKKEHCPDGSKDENVFDIQQGVAIGIFVKRPHKGKHECKVRHFDLWGKRHEKYEWLSENSIPTTQWTETAPSAPFHMFASQDDKLREEYEKCWSIPSIYVLNSLGIATARDSFSICWTEDDIWQVVQDFISMDAEQARRRYSLGADTHDWKVPLAQKDVVESGPMRKHLVRINYRPFDIRYTYYTGHSGGFHCRPRDEVMRHMLNGEGNLAISTTRSVEIGRDWEHVFCMRDLTQLHSVSLKEVNYHFPLYVYPDRMSNGTLWEDEYANSPGRRRPNLSHQFIADFSKRLGMTFIPDGKGDRVSTFGPEDVFDYMYAVFHSPTYRARYTQFLKIDFPRLPLTSNPALFIRLCELGAELVALHLMDKTGKAPAAYNQPGTDVVERVRYTEPGQGAQIGRVWINDTQYFENVPPEVWGFHVGGYQVCQKWLKDRKDRKLSYDDLLHYARIVAALGNTIRLMEDIDKAIEEYGGFPIT